MSDTSPREPEFFDAEELIPTQVNYFLLFFNGFMVVVGVWGMLKALSSEIPGGLFPLSVLVTIWFCWRFKRTNEENYNRRIAREFLKNEEPIQ